MGNFAKHVVNRADWKAGPWDKEPDRLEWRFDGVPCLAIRQRHGAWCGYVALTLDHPWSTGNAAETQAVVHGGITYGPSPCGDIVCHVPQSGESDDVRWIGFDCIHFDDGTPDGRYGGDYRDLDFVKNEVESLAKQCIRAQIDMMGL